jgi:hypothetical protein
MNIDWLEILGPLAIVAFAVLNWFFGRFRDKEEAPAQPSGSEREDLARRIQEEIRRKIAQRQGRTAERQSRTPAPPLRTSMPRPEVVATPPPPPVRKPVQQASGAPVLAMPAPDFIDQRDEFERQREESERILSKARESRAQKHTYGQAARGRGEFVGSLISMLRSPDGARRAFLYSEVFGIPVGFRPWPTFTPISDQQA